MTSWKGYLHHGPGARRLTADQVRAVVDGLDELLSQGLADNVVEGLDQSDAVRKLLRDCADNYPKDRSCATCDFERSGYCAHWEDDIPSAHFDAGCDRHQVDGVPF